MTAPQIQIACAKACGWKRDEPEIPDEYTNYIWWCKDGLIARTMDIPPFTTSHDAMAEALGTMTEEEWDNYVAFLGSETGTIYAKGMLKATPLQQAVAFLKAKNFYTPTT